MPSDKQDNPTSKITEEIEKGGRYWGTRRGYVRRGQIRGMIHDVGHDISSIESSLYGEMHEHGYGRQSEPAAFELKDSFADIDIARAEEQ
ncbi:hypothetical protein PG984_005577 [Apiospora sp. TS-2023a]